MSLWISSQTESKPPVKSGGSRTRFLLLLFASFAAHKTSSLFKVTGHAVPATRTYFPWQLGPFVFAALSASLWLINIAICGWPTQRDSRGEDECRSERVFRHPGTQTGGESVELQVGKGLQKKQMTKILKDSIYVNQLPRITASHSAF
ncbi:uncharacterized protein LOC120458141 [Drosophila santomea]|uniref:uncharacterized protein LOC120458141 n=1 Tax=Drosophila santomea TaxID=129105 RepID=UPI001953FB09|nr:uncharacterized protein LOC120458141 [Drosophila santomea]